MNRRHCWLGTIILFMVMMSIMNFGCSTEDVPIDDGSTGSTGMGDPDGGPDGGPDGPEDGADDESGDDTTSTTGSDTGEPDLGPCQTVDVEGAGTFDFVIEGVDVPIEISVEDVCDAVGSGLCESSGLTDDEPGPGDDRLDDEETYQVLVYRPDAGMGAWPEDPLPLVVFIPGANHHVFQEPPEIDRSIRYYDPILTEVARQGAIVIAIQPLGPMISSGLRRSLMTMTLIWARSDLDPMDGGFAHRDRLHGATVLMGHSRGGAASFLLTDEFSGFQSIFDEMNDLVLCATIPIAPRWGPLDVGTTIETATDITIPVSRSVPYLTLQGAIDEDTTGHAVSQYDALAPEDDVVAASLPGSLSDHDKLLVWIYGVTHNAFGGTSTSPTGTAIAEVVAPALIARFLRWQLLSPTPAAERALFMRIMDPLATELGDEDLDDPSLWTGVTYNEDYHEEYDRALLFAQYTQGLGRLSAAESQPPARRVIDLMTRRDGMQEIQDLGCGTSASFLTPQAVDALDVTGVEIDGLDPSDVCQGSAHDLLDDPSSSPNHHESRAIRVDWSSAGSIQWTMDMDVSTYTHLSIRLGSVASFEQLRCDMGVCEGTSDTCSDDDDCSYCRPPEEVTEATFEVEVELQFEDDDLMPLDPQVASAGISLPQQFFGSMTSPGPCGNAEPTTAMRTVRIPLQRFCEGPAATQHLRAITLTFPAQPTTRRVLIDSIELTRSDLDDEGTACSMLTAAWTCEATAQLEAIETSCDTEPTPDCPGLDLVYDEVDIPTVDDGLGQPFSGWVVHSPMGWVDDPGDPTQPELDSILARCVRACERQWAHDPFVTANCSANDVFEAPTLRYSPSLGPIHAIPHDQVDGSGLFMGESLSCNLHGDCCEQFDEPAVCTAAPARLTPAAAPLGTGEEWHLAVEGVTWADSSYAEDPVMAEMVGTIGYSFCAEGDEVSCPFYVGSLELELTEPLELELDCNASLELHELTELEIRLAQPALGIAQQGTSAKAFPPGSVVVEATGVVDGFPIHSRAPIESPIYYQAGVGWVLLQGTGGSYLDFEVPCNGELADVKVAWGFEEVAVNEAPPSVSISGLPSSVSCPDELELDVTSASDPDDDIVSLRWIVDGVLLTGPSPTIPFTQAHEITAVVRDARGATTTDTTTITCN